MKHFYSFCLLSLLSLSIVFAINSCSKGGGETNNPPASNPCAGVSISVTATVTNPSAAGAANGSIAASASGGSGFSFSMNGGAFQASGVFGNLAAGSYTITAKDQNGCSGSAIFTLTAPNACTGVTITISNTITNNTPCQSPSTGSITITPSGGTGPYTYSINAGPFRASNVFTALATNNYVVTVKDANGCSTSSNAQVLDVPSGPKFAAVRSMMQINCVPCHNGTIQEGGMNWTVDCNIVTFKDRIKIRAVDGNPSPMPPGSPLPSSEQQKIINWINAGGRYSD